jgi:hypothetical protein
MKKNAMNKFISLFILLVGDLLNIILFLIISKNKKKELSLKELK